MKITNFTMKHLLYLFSLIVIPIITKCEDVKVNFSSLQLNETEEETLTSLYSNCSADCEKNQTCVGITIYKEDPSSELLCLNSLIDSIEEEGNKTIIYRAILKSKLKKVRHLPYTKRRQAQKLFRAKRLTRSTRKRDLRDENKEVENIFPILSPKQDKITFSSLPQFPTNPIIETEKDEKDSEELPSSSDYSESDEDLAIQKLDEDLNSPVQKLKLVSNSDELIVSTPKPNPAHVDPKHPDFFKEVETFEEKNHLKLGEPVIPISEKLKSPDFVASSFEKDLASKLKEEDTEGISESEPELSKEEILEVTSGIKSSKKKSNKKKIHESHGAIDVRHGVETSTTSGEIEESTLETATEEISTIPNSLVLTPEEQVTLFPETDADEIRKILKPSTDPKDHKVNSFKSKKIPFKHIGLFSKSTTLKPLTITPLPPTVPSLQNIALPPKAQETPNAINHVTISPLASQGNLPINVPVHMVQVQNPFLSFPEQNAIKTSPIKASGIEQQGQMSQVDKTTPQLMNIKQSLMLPQLLRDSQPINVVFDKNENHPLFFKIPILPTSQERFPMGPQTPEIKQMHKAPSEDEACLFEDRELFKRFLTAITFGFLDGKPMMVSFIENSHCVAAFSKSGAETLLSLRKIFKDFPQNEKVVAAGTFNDSIYLFDSAHNQRVWKYPIGLTTLKLNDLQVTSSMSKIDFLTSVCGFERNDKFFGPMEIEAFYEVPKGDGTSGCILFDKTRDPLMTPKVTFESVSLVDSIRALLESEFVNFVRGVFSWGDEVPAKSFYVYGSNGELYGIHRNEKLRTGGGWMQPSFTSVPYEVFPH